MIYHTQGEEAKISISQLIFVFIYNAEYEIISLVIVYNFYMTAQFLWQYYGRGVPSFSVYRRDI